MLNVDPRFRGALKVTLDYADGTRLESHGLTQAQANRIVAQCSDARQLVRVTVAEDAAWQPQESAS